MTAYQENRLIVYKAKIEMLKNDANYFKKNMFSFVLFGIGFSIIAPFYGQDSTNLGNSETVAEKLGGGYLQAVLFCAALYFTLLIIGTLVFPLQDKLKVKNFRKKLML
ncbi:hypothetical protein [Aquimarina agarivorans]|uniref:hypothetical protein n=1 Tax=Aquimarina agarivorans TaxID=980584 RepID=UPI0002F46EAD|nr:hypothetical protein [Aquimarina agarivorans]